METLVIALMISGCALWAKLQYEHLRADYLLSEEQMYR